MKIVLLGAGSFVFGPSTLRDILVTHRLECDLALMDVDPVVVERMAGVARQMARDSGCRARITFTTQRAQALDGADFVICAAAREMARRAAMDIAIADRHLPGALLTECGGVSGISYSLRQIALVQEIAADMRRCCPRAWFLTASNPLPRVAQAMHEEGIRTAGFCSASLEVYAHLWRALQGAALEYPFAAARERWSVVVAGLNHLTWLVEARDRHTGASVATAPSGTGHAFCEELGRLTGHLLLPNDHHVRDFFAPRPPLPARTAYGHGSDAERQQRWERLRAVAEGRSPWRELVAHESWEKPVDLIADPDGATLHSINLVNAGRWPELPAGVFIETPATGWTPLPVRLPCGVVPYCQRTALVTDTIVRAARQRSRSLLAAAVELDPTITDKRAGWAAVRECLAAHADILPRYD